MRDAVNGGGGVSKEEFLPCRAADTPRPGLGRGGILSGYTKLSMGSRSAEGMCRGGA